MNETHLSSTLRLGKSYEDYGIYKLEINKANRRNYNDDNNLAAYVDGSIIR